MQTTLLALRAVVLVLVLSIVLGGHFGGDAGHQSTAGHDLQIVTGATMPTDLAASHCVTSASCHFVLPADVTLGASVALSEPLSMATSGLIGSPLLNTLFRPPRQI